jgi:biopolymer transport protein ExbD
MSKIKMPVRSPRMDMTPMVDLFSLLLTFFMLTTSFRPQEAAQVDTPSSISEKITPDVNVVTIFISKDNKIFFNIDNGKDSTLHVRKKLLADMGTQYNIKFTEEQLQKFDKLPSFGMPIKNVAAWLDEKDSKLRDAMQIGIPMDSTDNQLAMWMLFARKANPNAEAAVKGDMQADYKVAKKVFDILQDVKINKFNLTTNLEKVEVSLKDVK